MQINRNKVAFNTMRYSIPVHPILTIKLTRHVGLVLLTAATYLARYAATDIWLTPQSYT